MTAADVLHDPERLEAQLRAAAGLLSPEHRFAAAHELNNALAVVVAALEILSVNATPGDRGVARDGVAAAWRLARAVALLTGAEPPPGPPGTGDAPAP